MQGVVDRDCEATIRLAVGNTGGQRQMIEAVIDTGFTGFLPSPMLNQLGLQRYRREEAHWATEASAFLMCIVG